MYEHVHLTSFSKMRVDLAAQVYTCIYYVCNIHTIMEVYFYQNFIYVGDEFNSGRCFALN